MDSLEYIDSYFKGELLPEETRQMEKRIEQDPAFAEEVAFYLSAMQAARSEAAEEKKARFRKLYAEHPVQVGTPVRKLWYYMAAAAVMTAFVVGGYLYVQNSSPQRIADRYIREQLGSMSLNMGVKDSMQQAKALYNNGEIEAASHLFESMANNRPADYSAREMAGITALRLGKYNEAIGYFRQVEGVQLVSNNSYFYHAIALLKRNRPGDISEARQLLQRVVSQHEDNQETALKLLNAL